MDDCLFCKIAAGEIPCGKVYEDEEVLAFTDIDPKAPVHLLIIPKKHIASVMETGEQDMGIFAHITRQVALRRPTFVADDIAAHAMFLYKKNWDASQRPIRSIGVRITDLCPIDQYTQLCFLSGRRQALENLEFAKDDITARFGKGSLTRACLLQTTVGERNPKEQHVVHPLSYFRA